MEHTKFCQSCTLPIDNMADRGTEKDGSKSELYCRYCYKDGEFTDPAMTLDRMKILAVHEMKKQHLPDAMIQQSLMMLPTLKRWNVAALHN